MTVVATFIHSVHTGPELLVHRVWQAVLYYNLLFYLAKILLSTGSVAPNNNNKIILSNIY